jgi:hypothetical protein
MNIDYEKSVVFILRAMHRKGGVGQFKDWLEYNKLLEEDSNEDKVNVRDNVKLKKSEIENLEKFYKKDELDRIYDRLSHYKMSKGKRYKSDYGAIQMWVIESVLGQKRNTPINGHVSHWNEE